VPAFPSQGYLGDPTSYKSYVGLTSMAYGKITVSMAAGYFRYTQITHNSVKRTKLSPPVLPEYFEISRGFNQLCGSQYYGYLGGDPYYSIGWSRTPEIAYGSIFEGNFNKTDGTIQQLDVNALRGKVLARLLDQLRGEHGDLAVDVLEGKQTIKMLRDLTNVRKQIDNFRKSVFSGSKRKQKSFKYVRDQWMQYRYGIRPLISSIYDTMDAIQKQHSVRKVVLTNSTHRTVRRIQITGSGSHGDPTAMSILETTYRYRMTAAFQLKTGNWLSDFTSLNPAGWIWETIPLSFVADWFVNVGRTIENWENWFQFRDAFSHGYETVTKLEKRTFKYGGMSTYPVSYWPSTPPQPKDGDTLRRRFGGSTFEYRYKNRTVLSSLPTPSGPRVKVNLNAAKVVDLCAIISQKLRF